MVKPGDTNLIQIFKLAQQSWLCYRVNKANRINDGVILGRRKDFFQGGNSWSFQGVAKRSFPEGQQWSKHFS